MTSIRYNAARLPLAVLAAAPSEVKLVSEDGGEVTLTSPETNEKLTGDLLVLRYLGRVNSLYGKDAMAATQVDFMLGLIPEAQDKALVVGLLETLQAHLKFRTFLVGHTCTIADYAIVAALLENPRWSSLAKLGLAGNVTRWFNFIVSRPELATLIERQDTMDKKNRKDKDGAGGSYEVHLVGATEGKVVTRFPPEPSGYLHVGHIKALLLNDYFAKQYKGRMILRFDDTNPSKEKDEYVQSIMEDCDTLKVDYGGPSKITHTSDWFPLLLECATQLVQQGDAYVDDTEKDQMREERKLKIESVARSNSVEQNLALWRDMQAATEHGKLCVLRAKIDMQSENGALRDPTLYRCNTETPHHRTGFEYKVYPTYDFACPIVDSKEGVSHVLRSVEFQARDEQFRWILAKLKLRVPEIWEYSRLNFVYTLMSKRKLQWFVDQKLVQGWTDPRFPTVRGLLRRGLTVDGLRQFIQSQGASRNSTLMQWDKLWTINKKVIDPIAPRYTAIATESTPCIFSIVDATNQVKKMDLHPKNAAVGQKDVFYANQVLLEQDDAKTIEPGQEVTLMGWGNAIVETVAKDECGNVTQLTGRLNLQGDVKATSAKLTWLALTPEHKQVECTLVEVDHIITVAKLEEDQKVEAVVNPNTWLETRATGEAALRATKRGQILQIQRRGFFVCDREWSAAEPLLLIYVPDGNQKASSVLSSKVSKKVEIQGPSQGKQQKKKVVEDAVPQEDTAKFHFDETESNDQ
jgi:glutamyl-tRNA synthetase